MFCCDRAQQHWLHDRRPLRRGAHGRKLLVVRLLLIVRIRVSATARGQALPCLDLPPARLLYQPWDVCARERVALETRGRPGDVRLPLCADARARADAADAADAKADAKAEGPGLWLLDRAGVAERARQGQRLGLRARPRVPTTWLLDSPPE